MHCCSWVSRPILLKTEITEKLAANHHYQDPLCMFCLGTRGTWALLVPPCRMHTISHILCLAQADAADLTFHLRTVTGGTDWWWWWWWYCTEPANTLNPCLESAEATAAIIQENWFNKQQIEIERWRCVVKSMNWKMTKLKINWFIFFIVFLR